LRNKVLAGRLYGGPFAQEVADEISDMLDGGRIDPAIAAALLRALALRPGQAGDVQAGTGDGGDARILNPPDGWGAGGTDRWGGGGKEPAAPRYGEPSNNPGFLFSTDWREGKSRRGHGLMKGGNRSKAEIG
jgi:hypothetical protein